jgi:putative phosphonate metabolism protein
MSARYAIYYMPEPDTALARFGAAAIGYDAWSGARVPFPGLALYSGTDAPAWTRDPARYGFHATLKAPFHLREGTREADLHALVADFAERRPSVSLGSLDVVALSRFLALCPRAPSKALMALAADCVTYFDGFRAPLTDADRARRLAAPLSERQISYLDAWGYPYVLDEFRFHMTLAGPLDEATKAVLKEALAALWEPISVPVTLDAIAIACQPSRDGPFVVQARYPLAGGA